MLNILLIDDHCLFTELLVPALEQAQAGLVIHQTNSIQAGLNMLKSVDSVDLIILDLSFSHEHSWSHFPFSHHEVKEIPILILTASTSKADFNIAMEKGCKGYMTKTVSKQRLLTAIKSILNGHTYFSDDMLSVQPFKKGPITSDRHLPNPGFKTLSDRQNQILNYLSKGYTNRAIAQRCGISEGTVKLHVSTILKALGVANRTQAVIKVNELKLKNNLF